LRPNAQRESTRRGGGTALSATHDHQSDQRDDDQGDDPERPLLDSGETVAKDLIGNGRICDGAQTQALRCRSPVDRDNGKLARASAPLAFSSVTSQEAKSFALDGGYGPDARGGIPAMAIE
jgi:hypothetical protein